MRAFAKHFKELQQAPKSLQRNVRLMLHARFFNHVYSTFLLADAGLIGDASVCARVALEVLAADWAVATKPDLAEHYHDDEFPKPVEVRKMLEDAGYSGLANGIRDRYSALCNFVHVTRRPERELSRWHSETDGELLLGGDLNETATKRVLALAGDLFRMMAQGPGARETPD